MVVTSSFVVVTLFFLVITFFLGVTTPFLRVVTTIKNGYRSVLGVVHPTDV